MGLSFKIITLCILCFVLLVLVIVLALVWSMPDLPSTVSNNKICLPAEKGHLVCDDTPHRLNGYLNRIISDSYDQVRKKEEVQQQRFFKENQGHLMAIYDKYFWEMKPSAKGTEKKQPVNTKDKKNEEMTPIRVWLHGKELFNTSGFLRLLSEPDLNWIFDYKKIITPRKIDHKDGTKFLEICVHNRIFLDEDTTSYIHQDVYITNSLNATYESCKPSCDYEMQRFVGLSVSVLFIGIMLFKTRLEVWTIVNGKFGLCDGCHEARNIVRLVSCRPYKHFLCHSCLERLHYCPECNTSIRAFM